MKGYDAFRYIMLYRVITDLYCFFCHTDMHTGALITLPFVLPTVVQNNYTIGVMVKLRSISTA